MRKKYLLWALPVLSFLMGVVSCKKDQPTPDNPKKTEIKSSMPMISPWITEANPEQIKAYEEKLGLRRFIKEEKGELLFVRKKETKDESFLGIIRYPIGETAKKENAAITMVWTMNEARFKSQETTNFLKENGWDYAYNSKSGTEENSFSIYYYKREGYFIIFTPMSNDMMLGLIKKGKCPEPEKEKLNINNLKYDDLPLHDANVGTYTPEKIKAYEEQLGLRQFSEDNDGAMKFLSKERGVGNFDLVTYTYSPRDGKHKILALSTSLKEEYLEKKEVKDWLARQGFIFDTKIDMGNNKYAHIYKDQKKIYSLTIAATKKDYLAFLFLPTEQENPPKQKIDYFLILPYFNWNLSLTQGNEIQKQEEGRGMMVSYTGENKSNEEFWMEATRKDQSKVGVKKIYYYPPFDKTQDRKLESIHVEFDYGLMEADGQTPLSGKSELIKKFLTNNGFTFGEEYEKKALMSDKMETHWTYSKANVADADLVLRDYDGKKRLEIDFYAQQNDDE